MATTTYIDATFQVRGIGARTDNVGVAVSDLSAEEDRLPHGSLFSEGALSDLAFSLAAGSGMNTTLGSGTSKADRFVVSGDIAGQGNYVVALAQTSVTVAVPAADASQQRIDEVYLVVLDAPYDSNTLGTASAPLSLPRLGYRKGVAGGAAPGPDTLWKASALLATVTVPAAASSIVAGNITDSRAFAVLDGANPPGTIIDFAGTAVPAGYVACDGSSVLRATYRRLFAAIGTTHGAADGTHFNLPDHGAKLPVGYKSGDADFGTVGATGGGKTKTLSTGNLPAHDHGAGGTHHHTTAISAQAQAGANTTSPYDDGGAGTGPYGNFKTTDSGSHTHTSVGSGTAFDVLNPFIVITKAIRT